MLKIAIVGNIASGKSEVEKILVKLGYKVADSDKINHYILMNDISVINEVRAIFGDNVFDKNGIILKQELAKIIFNDKQKKEKLENILHPRIFSKIDDFFGQNINEKFAFVSVPLLFETGMENYFDKIVFISCSEDTRLKRLMSRNNLTKENALKRITSQGIEKDKIEKSHFVIHNNSDISALEKEVVNLLSLLTSL